MADVFISYSRLDRERVRPLAERLASLGYSLWWEPSDQPRQTSIDDRARALEEARAVLAVWSMNGRNAAELHADAAAALDAGKLLQLRLDAPPPAPFDTLAAADMAGGEWGPLEQALSGLVTDGQSIEAPKRVAPGFAPTMAATGAPKLVAVAVIAVLAAFAGGLAATFNGVMKPDQLQIALVGVLGVAGACAGLSAHRLFTMIRTAA